MAPAIAIQYAGQIAGFIKERCAGKQGRCGDGEMAKARLRFCGWFAALPVLKVNV